MTAAPCLSRRLLSRACALVCVFAVPALLHAQNAVSPASSANVLTGVQSSSSAENSPDLSVKDLPRNFLRDQKRMWLFPARLARGDKWAPTVTLTAATIAMLSADPHVQPYFNHTQTFEGFNRAFASNATGIETIAVPMALFAAGLGRHDSYMSQTALLAGEAAADSEMLRMVLNSVTTRWRPQDIYRRRAFSDTFFHSRSRVGSSFPSGHMIAAVSIATIVARRYRTHRWVPWAAYGFAGMIGFSRITLRAHFPSDVVLGSVFGYAIARYDVLHDP